MSDYTPTTEEVREDYALGRNEVVGAGWYDQHRAEFDRWLAAHDAEKRAEWEAEQGDKPAPCVMTHTPPFNFAQCETHDETFPLGGACKWHGKESIYEVLDDEADELRLRAVRAEHQLEVLRAEQGETEWEYGIEYSPSNEEFEGDSREHHERQVNGIRKNGGLYAPTARVMRRRRAGDSEPVPATNNESEGKA